MKEILASDWSMNQILFSDWSMNQILASDWSMNQILVSDWLMTYVFLDVGASKHRAELARQGSLADRHLPASLQARRQNSGGDR